LIRCTGCGATYAVTDGIPILSHPNDGRRDGEQHNRSQAAFFDAQPAGWETTRPRGGPALHGWLLREKFLRSIAGLEPILSSATVLTVCGGSGMDAEFLARSGASVIASDISPGAALRAKARAERAGLPITAIVADAQALPFRDQSVDIVYVHDGLHHLADPLSGLLEMARVARQAVSVTEPARAAATALAVRFGIAVIDEDAGNRVERLDPADVVERLRAVGFKRADWERYAMYYRHEPGPLAHLLSRRHLVSPAQIGFGMANRLIGSLGNKLSVRALRAETVPPVRE
jgi:SAM-dependent methyltransferase